MWGGGEKSRMKNASYEGRIGDSAYIFKPGETEPTKVFSKGDRILSVPANSIVFVESDLYFRVPEFIALRFNLQIKHVHRGLLLGTGPLIDPGYWGKLCIPLHNLTDEDYYIPADEGLIWIEFTKTTKIEERIGRPPLGKEFQEIRGFLEKASQLLDTPSKKVGIRSSIPSALVDSATSAEKAAESAQKAKVAIQRIGWGGIVAAVIALIALVIPLYQMNNTYSSDVLSGFKEVFSTTSSLESALNAERIARKKIEAEIRELKDGISKLCSILENKEQQRACLSIDIKP